MFTLIVRRTKSDGFSPIPVVYFLPSVALKLLVFFSLPSFLFSFLLSLSPSLPFSLAASPPLRLPAWRADIGSPREVLRCGKEPWL